MMTNLALGNSAFREARYSDALEYYNQALQEHPELVEIISANLALTRKKTNLKNIDADSSTEITSIKSQILLNDLDDSIISRAEKLFDSEFYAAKNSDIDVLNGNYFQHFCCYGWREQRDPNPLFSIKEYLKLNPDALEADINPLLHYVASEGIRDIGGIFDVTYYLEQYSNVFDKTLLPLEHFVFWATQLDEAKSRCEFVSFFSTRRNDIITLAASKFVTVQVQDVVSEALTFTTSCNYDSLRRPVFADFRDNEPAKSSGI